MTDTQGQRSSWRGQEEPVGTLAEEAAKLLQALQGLARGQAGDAGRIAEGVGAVWQDLNEHLASGEDCRYCPLCQLVALARRTSPEVRQHLASAAGSLVAALAGALATPAPDGQEGGPGMHHTDPHGGD